MNMFLHMFDVLSAPVCTLVYHIAFLTAINASAFVLRSTALGPYKTTTRTARSAKHVEHMQKHVHNASATYQYRRAKHDDMF